MKENFFQIALSSKVEKPKIDHNNIFKTFGNINYKLYTFREIRKEFYKDSNSKVEEAFSHVKAYAFKADIFRYYLLYKYGGWYSDLNNIFSGTKIDTSNIDMFCFKEMVPGSSQPNSVQNSILYAKKENKFIKAALDQAINNVLSNFYGDHPLSVTGPVVIGKAIYEQYDDLDRLGSFIANDSGQRLFLLPNSEIFAYYKPKAYLPAESGLQGGNNYNDFWYSKTLYGERPRL